MPSVNHMEVDKWTCCTVIAGMKNPALQGRAHHKSDDGLVHLKTAAVDAGCFCAVELFHSLIDLFSQEDICLLQHYVSSVSYHHR